MKTYLVTTGVLFGLMAALHVWRAIAEWPDRIGLPFVFEMGLLIALPAALCGWAWTLWRKTQ